MNVLDQTSEDISVVKLINVHLWRDRTLLQGINWTVTRGQHWVVLGRNGAGKTLLLKILAGYLWPSKGEVWVLEKRFGRVDLPELRKRMGWVSSSLTEKIPVRDTALEVVLSGAFATMGLFQTPSPDIVRKAEQLMEDMGLSALGTQEFGLLSAGEKQRTLLARARMPQPSLLILDEPCAGLDFTAREKFLAVVGRMAADPGGPTMIMVTHRVSEIMPGFTHGLFLNSGREVVSGPLKRILKDELLSGVYDIPLHVTHRNGRWQVQVK